MQIDEIREYCLALPGVTEDIKWEDHLCFNIGEKMFLVTNPDQIPVSVTLKTTDERFEILITQEGVLPAPYMARNKWVQIDSLSRFNSEEWKLLIDTSYALIFAKLPVKTKTALHPNWKKI